jgi:predicted alpha/beta hydrolase
MGFQVLAFDFRGFGKSTAPGDSDMFTVHAQLDVLAAVHYLRRDGAKTAAVMGGNFGGTQHRTCCPKRAFRTHSRGAQTIARRLKEYNF